MSTEYELTDDISIVEHSCSISFLNTDTLSMSKPIDAGAFRKAIIKQIEILSYISDDQDEVMARFSVKYGQEN